MSKIIILFINNYLYFGKIITINEDNKFRKYMMKKILLNCIIIFFLFNKLFPADYYWIGGSGNWSEISHWAIASGSTTTHLVVPTQDDDVYFDANSFSQNGCIVKINSSAVCKGMNWTGAAYNPTLSGDFNNLRIYGSLTLIPAMNLTFAGQIYFESINYGNTIVTAGKQLKYNVTFDGIGGGWTLNDGMDVTGNITLVNGSLNTNSQPIKCSRFVSTQNNLRTLNLGASLITVIGNGNNPEWNIEEKALTFSAGTSTIMFTGSDVSVFPGNKLNYYKLIFADSSSTHTLNDSSTYMKVEFRGNGVIQKNNTYDTLAFSPGMLYVLQAGRTQFINSSLTALGTCTGSITIRSSVPENSTFISKAGGLIDIEYVTLRDCWANGGAVFTARNSVDLGNNNGWNIFPAPPLNLYWVGGTGDWTDPSHWSLSSGGPGGACIPTPNDNVYFDANSFTADSQSVTINTGNATCGNMSWNGANFNPVLKGPNTNELAIYGSLELNQNMSQTFTGYVYFESQAQGKTIKTNGKQFLNNIIFEGDGGGWTLLDSLNCASSISFYHGTLNTNNQSVTCERFISDVNNARTLDLGSSLITLIGSGKNAQWNVVNTGMTFDCGTSLIRFIGKEVSMFSGNGLNYYNVEFYDPNETYSLYSASTFNKVTFFGNGIIFDNNSYNDLIFSAGKSYIFYSNSIQTIYNRFLVPGTCASPVSMFATSNGLNATIHKDSATVTISYVTMRDIHAEGTAVFTANNSIDLGNNTGWIINSRTPKDLYWVGGTGDWTDPSHWSLTSGGIGGACIPTGIDNVFFDVNSFKMPGQVVFLNSRNAACNNMNWTGSAFSPLFAGDSVDIRIFGSLTFIPNMTITYNGQYIFEAISFDQTISTGNNQLNSNFIFNGIGGSWYLQDSLKTTGIISQFHGILNTNSKHIIASRLVSNEDNARTLVLGSSNITLTGSGTNPEWYLLDRNLFFNSGNSILKFTGSDVAMVAGKGLKYYNVEFRNQSSGTLVYDSAAYNRMTILGNGTFYNGNIYDTLTFSPGKTYILPSGLSQKVNKQLDIRGNNCFPIIMRGSNSGTQALITKPSGIVSGDFIEMRDIQAAGGATFYAGKFSKDISDNSGWIFNNSPGYIYGLGPDQEICPGEEIKTNNFNGAIAYLWQDGSTDSIYTITQPGIYWVTATYANNCTYTDTIVVSLKPTPSVDAGRDTVFCEGDSARVRLDGKVTGGITPYQSIRWSPATGLSSTSTLNPLATPTVTTSYELAVMGANGCIGRDTVTITINPNVVLDFQNVTDTLDFGNVCIDGETDSLIEIHNSSLTETTVIADVSPPGFFSLNSNPMNVKFKPDETIRLKVKALGNGTEGTYYGKLNFTDLCNKTRSFVLKVTAFKPKPSFPDTLDFGALCLNDSAIKAFSFINESSVPTSFTGKTDSNSSFSLTDYSLTDRFNSNESRNIPVFFKGSAFESNFIDSLIIIDTCGDSKILILKANPFQPKMAFPDTLDFGKVCINTQEATSFAFINQSSRETSFNLINNTSQFAVDADAFSIPYASNETRIVVVSFSAQPIVGNVVDSIQISDTCGGTKTLILKANVVDPKLIPDSLSILIDSVDNGQRVVRHIVVRNTGNTPVTVDSLSSVPQYFRVLNTTPGLPYNLQPGDSLSIDLEFYAFDDKLHTFTLSIYSGLPCPFADSIPVLAQGLPVSAKVFLVVQSDSSNVGVPVSIPVIITSSLGLKQSGITDFTIRLNLNKTVLKPQGNTPNGTITGDRRLIEISGTIQDTVGVLTKLDLLTALGDEECSTISIDTVIMTGGRCTVFKTDGLFCLKGLCKEGGTRLFSSNGKTALLDAKPNPANDKITFDFEVIEAAPTSLYIVDIMGRKREIVYSATPEPGIYSVEYNAMNLENGVYMYVLQTPSQLISKIFNILR